MFLDIAIGIYVAAFLGRMLGFGPDAWFFIGGILMTVLPDSDFLYYFLKRKKDRDRIDDCSHRDYIHYPLIYLPLGTFIFYLFGGNEWALLFFFCSFLHFIHDSIGIGWGIKWLYPFSTNNFGFFYLYSRKGNRSPKRILFSINKEQMGHYVREYGDKDWFKNIYLKLHPIAVVEYTVFVSSIIFLLFYIL